MRLGFIGVGNMGGPMAGHLIGAGHEVGVYDLRAESVDPLVEAGGRRAVSPADTADGTEAVLLSLPKPSDVELITTADGGLFDAMEAGTTILDLTTSSPTVSRELARQGGERGVSFLDAPVSGGVRGARKGTLAVMVGGPENVFATYEPVLAAFAAKVVHCGDVGAGNVVKLVNNMLAFINMMGVTEGLLLGTRAGVDPMVLREVIQASSGASSVWDGATLAILRDRLAPSFTTSLASKDIGLAVDLAHELDVPVPMGEHTHGLLADYRDNGFADEDLLATVRALEEQADFIVRGLAPRQD
ncbi:MAG: NAD(P)-dependent oxidoreductase [Actinomycetia bacterium]|nr:NAD(P)-dependent oxidoreductase [Actinomycetes bacterium]MCP5035418.1 NAD(P)-dependent oxidoreductase [Actinomycetes bacterium]